MLDDNSSIFGKIGTILFHKLYLCCAVFLQLFHHLHLFCKFEHYPSPIWQKIKIGFFELAWIMVRGSMISNMMTQKWTQNGIGPLSFLVQGKRGEAKLLYFFLASNSGLCCCWVKVQNSKGYTLRIATRYNSSDFEVSKRKYFGYVKQLKWETCFPSPSQRIWGAPWRWARGRACCAAGRGRGSRGSSRCRCWCHSRSRWRCRRWRRTGLQAGTNKNGYLGFLAYKGICLSVQRI